MGKIISNGIEYTGGGSGGNGSSIVNWESIIGKPDNLAQAVHLTQEEYDALPDTKLTDGIIYLVTSDEEDDDIITEVFSIIGRVDNIEINLGAEVSRATAAEVQVLTDAKAYTDKQISEMDIPDVSDQISTHNTNTSAHNDMRILINEVTERLNALADSDDETLDQLSEIVAYIKSNKTLIEEVTTTKANVADIIDNLETAVANKPLSANQGVELKKLIDSLVIAWDVIEDKPANIAFISEESEEVAIETPVELTRNDIADNLTTYDSNKVLSANQGATLGSRYNTLSSVVGDDIDEYSENSTYAVGDYCLYLGTLFKCISAINTPIAFDGSNHWKATTLSTEVKELNTSMNGLKFRLYTQTATRNVTYPNLIQFYVGNVGGKKVFVTPSNDVIIPHGISRVTIHENIVQVVFFGNLEENKEYTFDLLVIEY